MSATQVPAASPATRRGPTLPAGLALAGGAITFTSLYLGAGVLTPLLVVYKERWQFPPSLLTLAFAVYAVGFLAAILTLGSLSDHVGRRPVLIAALIIQLASNVLFLVAPDIGWVIAGRIVQGVGTGAASSALTAALVEVAPANRKRLATIFGSVSVTGGLAVGSLLAGLATQLTSAANSIVFVALIVLTILGVAVVVLTPETVSRTPGALHSLVPHISVPRAARGEFTAAAPVVAAAWMLAGLSGGLAPSMVRSVFHLNNALLNGVSGFVAPAASAVVGLAFARVEPRRAMTIGIYASIVGPLGIVGGVYVGSLAIMIVGQAIAGVGFGAAFTAALRLMLPLAAADQSAGVVAAIYLVSYVAFGVPIVIAGYLAGPLGEVHAVYWYTVLTVLLAVGSLAAQIRIERHARSVRASARGTGRGAGRGDTSEGDEALPTSSTLTAGTR
ncbi:MAG: major facilitator superfamily 1 [Frankiales bacterium]|nr:major facilitator superfamily 1 [Frankiales bacterium]